MSSSGSISSAFVAARKGACILSHYPGEVPATLEDAYRIQSQSIKEWDEPIAGFKVGGIGAKWQEQYPSPWLAGPIFSSLVYTATDGQYVDIPVFDGGFAAYEPELVIRFENPLRTTKSSNTVEDAKKFVRSLHIGAEIASSPLAQLNQLGPGSIISDFGNQAGMIIGSEISLSWLDRLDQIEVLTEIDGDPISHASPKPGDQGPLGALLFLLQHLRTRHIEGLEAEELWLSSGAITGVHEARVGSSCRMRYVALGDVNVNMVAREPLQ